MIDNSWYCRPRGLPTRHSAGGVVVRPEDDRLMVALVRDGELPGRFLPKGGIRGGEGPEETARREIAEEAGITDLRLLGFLGTCERLDYHKRFWVVTIYYLFTTDQAQGFPLDMGHNYSLEWQPIEQLRCMLWPEQKQLIESNLAVIVRSASAETQPGRGAA